MIWELERVPSFSAKRLLKGGVEVDEVYRLVFDVLAQDFEIVAVIELAFLHCGKILTRIGRLRNCWPVSVMEILRGPRRPRHTVLATLSGGTRAEEF
jgi:hypothetical protein